MSTVKTQSDKKDDSKGGCGSGCGNGCDRGEMNTVANESKSDYRSVLYSVDRDGRRKWLYVDIAKGAWRRRRKVLAIFLIAAYLFLPFLSIDGNSILRIDIPSRSYTLLGHVFWPQDFSYALMFVILGVVGTLLAVSVSGRVFCGWFCPHNVFLEMVFRPLERLIEGPAHRHRSRDARGSGAAKKGDKRLLRKFIKICVYMIIAGALANAATAIFVGTEPFIWGMFINPIEHPDAAIFYGIFYGLIMFNFAWFREQTCTLVCPYGRLQTAMLDSDTLIVAYDYNRGEPRGKKNSTEGDCVDCKRCIQVCPTGIDIRNGNQLECIHCTACIDACDTVMERLDLRTGLIGYRSENQLAGKPRRIIRPRTILYTVVFVLVLLATAARLYYRPLVDIVRLRQRTPPQMLQLDGVTYAQILLPLSFVNKSTEEKTLTLRCAEDEESSVLNMVQIIAQHNPLRLAPNQEQEQIFYLRVPLLDAGQAAQTIELQIVYDDVVHKRISVTIPVRSYVPPPTTSTTPTTSTSAEKE